MQGYGTCSDQQQQMLFPALPGVTYMAISDAPAYRWAGLPRSRRSACDLSPIAACGLKSACARRSCASMPNATAASPPCSCFPGCQMQDHRIRAPRLLYCSNPRVPARYECRYALLWCMLRGTCSRARSSAAGRLNGVCGTGPAQGQARVAKQLPGCAQVAAAPCALRRAACCFVQLDCSRACTCMLVL